MSEQTNEHSNSVALNSVIAIAAISVVIFIIWMVIQCTTCH